MMSGWTVVTGEDPCTSNLGSSKAWNGTEWNGMNGTVIFVSETKVQCKIFLPDTVQVVP